MVVGNAEFSHHEIGLPSLPREHDVIHAQDRHAGRIYTGYAHFLGGGATGFMVEPRRSDLNDQPIGQELFVLFDDLSGTQPRIELFE